MIVIKKIKLYQDPELDEEGRPNRRRNKAEIKITTKRRRFKI